MSDALQGAKPPRGQHDVAALAHELEGLDAARYINAQADDEYRAALRRWTTLARLMGLAPAQGAANHEAPLAALSTARSD
ncbi:hypothetical protein [Caballeronia sp. LZ034LL]|uniref:hypothetical protein n=1 Tax=Caballeronia sp. LZ034LL TaxID=3038567 RepID=UPI00285EA7B4|nr:hypothetical protein [Caballeronia sp. LZ034LL]MDR5836286.1 hypothetical protein [Caballeronia sp. LZ034LL]